MTSGTIGVHPVAGALGAEISGVDLSRPLPDATVAALRQAWLDHLVTGSATVHTTPEQARINLETTIAIERAVATGKAVRLPLEI